MEPVFKCEATDKAERYSHFIKYLRLLVSSDDATISVLANTVAALKEAFGFFWVGFYIVEDDCLILGPFQGSPACTRISRGKGVCGTAWAQGQGLIVPDVDQFPGHIACSSASRSEIVVPFFTTEGEVAGVLDIDSDSPNAFDRTDLVYLEAVVDVLSEVLY